jgi:hypothetical protein
VTTTSAAPGPSAPAPASPRPLWRNRDFGLLWTGQVMSDFGAGTTVLLLPLLLLAAGHSSSVAGTLGTVVLGTALLLRIPAGYVADRTPTRPLMVGCDLLRLLMIAVIAGCAYLGDLPVAVALLGVFVCQVSTELFRPAQSRVLRAAVPVDQLPSAVSLNQARAYAASIVAPSLAGALMLFGTGLPFLVAALTFGLSALCVLGVTGVHPAPVGPGKRLFPEMTAGLRYLAKDPFLRSAAAYFALLNLVFAALRFALLLSLGESGGAGAAMAGGALSVAAAAGLLGSLLAAWAQRHLPARVLFALGPALGPVIILTGHAFSPELALAATYATLCLFTPVIGVVLIAWLTGAVPEDLLGRVGSATGFVSELLQPLGPLIAGLLLSAVGVPSTAVVFGVVLAGLAVAALAVPAPLRAQ